MNGGDISLVRLEQVVGGVPSAIERDGGARAAPRAGAWIEAERDEVVAECRILERLVRDRIRLVLVDVGQRQRGVRPRSEHWPTRTTIPPRHGRASTVRVQGKRGLIGVPCLTGQREIVSWPEHVWLPEIQPDAFVEVGIARLYADGPCAAKEVHVAPVDLCSSLFFAAVPDTKIHSAVFPFGDGDSGRNVDRFVIETKRLDVGEVEELRRVKLALALLQRTLAKELPGPKRELATDDVVGNAGVAVDLYGPET